MGLNAFTRNLAGVGPFNMGPVGLRGAGMMAVSPFMNSFGSMGMPHVFNRFGPGIGHQNFGLNTLGGNNDYSWLNGVANSNPLGGIGGIGGVGGIGGIAGVGGIGGTNSFAGVNSLAGMNAGLGYAGFPISGLSNGLAGFSSLNQLNNPLNNVNSFLGTGFNGLGFNRINSFNAGFNGINGINGLNNINSQLPFSTGFNQFGNGVFGATGSRFPNGRDMSSSSGTSSFDNNDWLKRSQVDPTSPYYVQLSDNYGNTNSNREEQQDSGSFTSQKRNASGRSGGVIQHSANSQVRTNRPSL